MRRYRWRGRLQSRVDNGGCGNIHGNDFRANMNECEKTSERMASERKQKQGETPKQREKRQEIKLCQREQPIVEKKDENLPVHTE